MYIKSSGKGLGSPVIDVSVTCMIACVAGVNGEEEGERECIIKDS